MELCVEAISSSSSPSKSSTPSLPINVWPSRRDGKAKQKGELVDRAHGGGIIEKSRSFNDSID